MVGGQQMHNVTRLRGTVWIVFQIGLLTSTIASAEDWPMWRKDAGRTAATSEQLAETLHLQWSRSLGTLKPAWTEDPRIQFDAHYEPVIGGQTLFVGASRNDSVTAFDLNTGEQKWRFYANGPVRFAPVVAGDHLYVSSDDGYFYCLNSNDGALRWKFRAAPNDRKALANARLSSVWPIRGGAVLENGKIYFTCGVWPFEGTFLYTLDAQTGESIAPPNRKIKTLDKLTPQGYLVKNGDKLLIPCGRGIAACLDLEADRFISHLYGNRTTTFHVSSIGNYIFHGGSTYEMEAGKAYSLTALYPVLTDDVVYFGDYKYVVARDLHKPKIERRIDRRGKETIKTRLSLLWTLHNQKILDVPETDYLKWLESHPLRVDLKAGNRLYGHQDKSIFALNLSANGRDPRVSWTHTIKETPATMIAANGKLVVVTREGSLHCFGDQQTKTPRSYAEKNHALTVKQDEWVDRTGRLLNLTQGNRGYCLVLGAGTGRLIEELVRQSEFTIIAVEPDQKKVRQLREKFDSAGLYGSRVLVQQGDPLTFDLPAYLAELVVSEDLSAIGKTSDSRAWQAVFRSLRPYGGTACLELADDHYKQLSATITEKDFPRASLKQADGFVLLSRSGALAGAADWTHEYGDASNTLMSRDELVKAPLGVLWFGGPAGHGDLFYNRTYWGPSMAVIEGRMFLQGLGKLTAVDVYTGRLIWQIPLKETPENNPGRLGNDFEEKIAGHHFLAVRDGVYLVNSKKTCLRIDPATGETLAEFTLPNPDDDWGRIRVHGDLLLASAFGMSKKMGEKFGKLPLELVAMDRRSGDVVWTHRAEMSFPVVALSGERIYAFDGALENFYSHWKRRGQIPKTLDERYITAIDVDTGRQVWKHRTEVVGSWLSYSSRNDVLLVSNRETISAFRGIDGTEMWKKYATGRGFRGHAERPDHMGHPENLWDKIIVSNDQVLDQRGPGMAYELETGKPITRTNPITGKPIYWEFTKLGHHCNYAIASPHLLTFRAGSAGYCDIDSANTSRLEGFRSGCRNSLIPANGVLNSPNMAHGCECGYSLFTSLGLVHVPDAEFWSYSALKIDTTKDRVQRLGINLGAPGDRLAKNGTLWLDHPGVGGSSPAVSIELGGENLHYFNQHSAFVQAGDLKWVAASGVEGAASLTVTLASASSKPRSFTVRLHFLEPNDNQADQRVFDVHLQGQLVLKGFNPVKAANGSNRAVVCEFKDIQAATRLKIDLKAITGRTLLNGVEILAD